MLMSNFSLLAEMHVGLVASQSIYTMGIVSYAGHYYILPLWCWSYLTVCICAAIGASIGDGCNKTGMTSI